MNKKFISMMMAGMLAAGMLAATMAAGCGSASDSAVEDDAATYSEAAETEEAYDSSQETAESEETADSEGFSLGDVSADMISAAVYAKNADGDELVLAAYTAPSGDTYASLVDATNGDLWTILVTAEGTERATVETEDGSAVELTSFSGDDVYTGTPITIGVAEQEDGTSYVYDLNGNLYAGQSLTGEEAVTYLGAAIAVAAQ